MLLEALTGMIAASTPVLLAIINQQSKTNAHQSDMEKMMIDMSKGMKEMKNRVDNNTVVTLRLECLNAIEHDYGEEIVSNIYDRYKDAGGNSYVQHKVDKYLEDTKE